VTDQSNGKPVPAYLSYEILPDNPHFKDYPSYGTVRVQMRYYCDENGEFKEEHVASKGKCGLLFYHKERQLAGAYVG
jgi:hypothetical protein